MTAGQAGGATGATTETVAILGAGGTMGLPIARNIARAGFPVRAWNRTRDKAATLERDGAYIARSPADAARGAGIVITMLSDAGAVESVMNGPDGALSVMPGAHPHALWIQMSTIGEEATKRCTHLANDNGVGFLDAPVLGTRQPAEEGKLVILESGPEEARPRVQPLFDVIGQRTIRAGQAGAATRLKLVANSWVHSVVEAGAETIALAEGLGVDPGQLFQALEGGTLDLPYLRIKGEMMTEREFPASFRLSLAAKDADLIRRAARERALDLPLVELIADRFAEGAREHGDLDLSATYLTSAPRQRSHQPMVR